MDLLKGQWWEAVQDVIFPKNSNSFGVFSHSKGFGEELLSDSLWFCGADPSWAAKRFRWRFHQDSAKVPPRLHKFRGVSGLLGKFRLEPAKRFYGRFHQGCTEGSAKVPPRFHQGSSKGAPRFFKFRGVSGSHSFWGAKRFFGRFPHHFFKLVSQRLYSFLHFSSTALALGSSAIVKVLGQNDRFVFGGSLQQMVFASQKVLWSVPQTVLYIGLTLSCGFSGQSCCFIKGSVEGSANYSLHLSSVSSWGESCVNCWHVSPIQIQSAENDPSCRCCWGILWVYFFLPLWRYQQRRKLQDENKSKTDFRNEKHYINSMDNRKIFWSKHMVKGQELSSCFLYSTLIMYPFMAMIWSLAWSSSIRRYFRVLIVLCLWSKTSAVASMATIVLTTLWEKGW